MTQHPPAAFRAFLRVSSPCSPGDAKWRNVKAWTWNRYSQINLFNARLALYGT